MKLLFIDVFNQDRFVELSLVPYVYVV